MITSKYNFIFPYQEGTYLAYNSLTNDLAILEKNEYEEYDLPFLRKNLFGVTEQTSIMIPGSIYENKTVLQS